LHPYRLCEPSGLQLPELPPDLEVVNIAALVITARTALASRAKGSIVWVPA